jgi:two-component system, LytTR family, sensor kinase
MLNGANSVRLFDQACRCFDKVLCKWRTTCENTLHKVMYRNPKISSALVGHQMAFLTIVAFWVFYALISSLRSAVMDFPAQGELAYRRLIVTVIGIFLTWLLYLCLRFFDRKPLGIRIGAAFIAAIPVALTFAWFNFYVFYKFDPINLFEDPNLGRKVENLRQELGLTDWQEVAEIAISRYFFIIAWASLHLALGYAREVREAERMASRYAQAAQDSELRSLRYQVNPHFLFNTLNSLSSLVISGQNGQAEAMIQNLSTFYRTSLSNDPLEDVTLAEEVELQKQYLEIEAVRYPERLRTVIDIDPPLMHLHVPALILQPLVENAIKYGVSRTSRPVTISIVARQEGDKVRICVEDDGDIILADLSHGNGIGLANVRDRLEARFGNRAALAVQEKAKGGFTATITLPAKG